MKVICIDARIKRVRKSRRLLLAAVVTIRLAAADSFIKQIYNYSICNKAQQVQTKLTPPFVIAIDPGHGGMDTGAQAIVDECYVIDTTAGWLYRLLEQDADFIPVMTRTDTDPESSRRAETANSAGANLLISIHANSDSHSSSKGFECFPTPPGRVHHLKSLEFGQTVVEKMRQAGHTIRGDEHKTGIKYAYYYGKEKRIVDSSDEKARSRKSFGILEKTDCPRVLVEQCFITNYQDVENWASEQGCRQAADIYYQAIKEYFENF